MHFNWKRKINGNLLVSIANSQAQNNWVEKKTQKNPRNPKHATGQDGCSPKLRVQTPASDERPQFHMSCGRILTPGLCTAPKWCLSLKVRFDFWEDKLFGGFFKWRFLKAFFSFWFRKRQEQRGFLEVIEKYNGPILSTFTNKHSGI